MKRLIIGIPGWSKGDDSFGAGKAYLNHLHRFGDVIILPPMEGMLDIVDLVVLPGGADTPSYRYNKPPGYYNTSADPFKEYFVEVNLQQYIDAGKGIWGTCLGAQQLAIHFGSILEQNIDLDTHGHSGEERGSAAHVVYLMNSYESMEKKLIQRQNKRRSFKVADHNKFLWTNSLHHQGIPLNGFPDEELEVIASSGDTLYVEAFKHKELPIVGCQFHVEEDYNELGMYLFEELVNKTSNDKSNKNSQGNTGSKAETKPSTANDANV